MGGKKESCEDLVDAQFESVMDDVRNILDAKDGEHPELGNIYDYGLCFDFVPAGTFSDQRENFWRWQISWGGPSSEFRIYENGEIEFWYLDWGDGACIQLDDEDKAVIEGIWDCHKDSAKQEALANE